MLYTVYILHSQHASRYYCGFTAGDLEDRIRRHNSKHRGFTGPYSDWLCIWKKALHDKSSAQILERKIKKRGIVRYLKDISG